MDSLQSFGDIAQGVPKLYDVAVEARWVVRWLGKEFFEVKFAKLEQDVISASDLAVVVLVDFVLAQVLHHAFLFAERQVCVSLPHEDMGKLGLECFQGKLVALYDKGSVLADWQNMANMTHTVP